MRNMAQDCDFAQEKNPTFSTIKYTWNVEVKKKL